MLNKECQIVVDVSVHYPPWRRELPQAETIAQNICEAALRATAIVGQAEYLEVSVVLADDSFVQELNAQYRNKDKPTNVLSFPSEELKPDEYGSVDPSVVLGDVILALQTLQTEAEQQNKSLQDHLCHMIVHGTLHLLGYDHQDEAQAEQMESLEVDILKNVGITNPYH